MARIGPDPVHEWTIKQKIEESGVYPRFTSLVQGPLYRHEDFTSEEFILLEAALSRSGVIVDLYCPLCGKEATFKGAHLVSAGLMLRESFMAPDQATTDDETMAFLSNLTVSCSRKCQSSARFHFAVRVSPQKGGDASNPKFWRRVQKIGQFPTYADLQIPEFPHLHLVLSEIDRAELNKAIGLAAHDSAIGAFVYLRRIFERLIESAHEEAINDKRWKEDAFQASSQMDKKVQMLKNHLPRLVVENRKIYSVLSIGLHQLTEELCIDVFEPVLDGIYAILEEIHAKNRQAKIRKEVPGSIDSVMKKIKVATTKPKKKST